MSRDRSSKTVTISGPGSDRAQTTQDFAIGIGIFILAIAFVFSFVPTIITPFADAGGAQTAQSDRIADTIVDNLSDDQNEINITEFETYYENQDRDELSKQLGLRTNLEGGPFDRVNITIEEFGDGSVSHAAGDTWDGEIGASTTRIVTTTEDGECDPACKLIVRVW